MVPPKLRGPEAPGPTLPPAEGLGALKDGRGDGIAWKDPPLGVKPLDEPPNDGAAGALNDGLGRLEEPPNAWEPPPIDGPEPNERLGPPENDLWTLDIRPPSDRPRPWTTLLATGPISTAIAAVITAARKLILFSAFIVLLLPSAS